MTEAVIQRNEVVLSARGLAKNYGEVRAVRNVDLEVRRGEIYGFLGLNGAGKTTTIRMLLGLITPSSGEIRLFGSSLKSNRAGILSRIGYLVETASAYPNLTVEENLEIQRKLRSLPSEETTYVISLLRLEEYRGRRAGKLSLGNKQRLSLARALLHRPELLILDEPANGLDPAGIIEIRSLLRRLADEEGVTIFMSSHLLDEVEQLADRIGIIHQGVLVEEKDVETLRSESPSSIEIEVDDQLKAERVLKDELGLASLRRLTESRLSITDNSVKPEHIARTLVGAGVALRLLKPVEEDLERHFIRLTGGVV